LGKPICKEYTLTDWDRRPLFRNQLHYAALDAVIVLKIWKVIKDKNPVTKEELNGDKPRRDEKSEKHKHEHYQKF
jgi:ribonuclease D